MESGPNAEARTVLAVQHVECESLGIIEQSLNARALSVRYIHIHQGHEVPETIGDCGGLIVMGGPMSAYDPLPHLAREMQLIQSALNARRPVLGVCLGSQLLAHTLGARVYPGARKEIGWHPVNLSEAAHAERLWSNVPRKFRAFHWHGEIFETPPRAVNLASSDLTACQAFRWGASA